MMRNGLNGWFHDWNILFNATFVNPGTKGLSAATALAQVASANKATVILMLGTMEQNRPRSDILCGNHLCQNDSWGGCIHPRRRN